MKNSKESIWTRSFLLIWQGQLVSTLGDVAYSIALGFWVLQTTGSTTLMGTLMAASALPGVLVSPFAGVWIDQGNKKFLMILMDILRGICMLFIAIAAFSDMLAIWMVFAAGIILSICGAVFRPGVNSSIPGIVPTSKLSNANSMLSIVSTGSNMIGNIAGGFLFQLLGAPLLFLINGLSYLFSGSSLTFASLPRIQKDNKPTIFQDMKDGFLYMWKQKGLRYLLMIAALVNFFSYISIVLFLPLFETTHYLGAGRYGIAMACFMGGAMFGYLFSSIVTIPAKLRIQLLILSNTITNVSLILGVNQRLFGIMIVLILLGGFFNSILNVILLTTVQAKTPNEMLGKVMAFLSMTTQSLTPLAMALGGVLASFLSIRLVISVSFGMVILVVTPFIFVKPFVKFVSYDNKNSTR